MLEPESDEHEPAIESLTLRLRNYRGLRRVDWELEPGVSLLVGPNGSGKTCLLSSLVFMAQVFAHGLSAALRASGTPSALRHIDADANDPIHLELQRGSVRWQLTLSVRGSAIDPNMGELVTYGDQVLARRALFADKFWLGPHDEQESRELRIEDRSCLRFLADNDLFREIRQLAGLYETLRELRYSFGFSATVLRNAQQEQDTDPYLHSRGKNLYSVLRNWLTAPRRHHGQFDWVVTELRHAFPTLFHDLEFDAVGRLVDARFFSPGRSSVEESLPLAVAADGLLVGLALLTATAGARPGSVLLLDELANHLHPHAIRSILTSIRSRAEERNLRVVISTHSPVAMNAFRDEPEALHVLEPGLDEIPKPLTELHDPDWLMNFALGDLYSRQTFAAQRASGQ